jgi:hypothetical protein
MWAVIGTWRRDPQLAERAHEALTTRIVPGVRELPGLVKGYRARSEGDRSHTCIVFAERAAAEAFAADVRGNTDNQAASGIEAVDLVVAEIVAET